MHLLDKKLIYKNLVRGFFPTLISFRYSRIDFCSKSLFKSFATKAKPFVLSKLLCDLKEQKND